MNLAFICSSLEPGRDGVGDYCRSLSIALKNLGHSSCLVSLNDPFANSFEESHQPAPMLRLPRESDWTARVKAATKFLDQCRAEWLSFQFVCYGFHPKGFVGRLPEISRPLIAGRKVHVMFHELWIGAAKNSALKDRLAGRLQKHFILRWLRAVKPHLVHTTNPAYRQLLALEKVFAGELPLFGNIAVCAENSEWMRSALSQFGVSAGTRNDFWIFGLFGGIPPEWKPAEMFDRLLPVAERNQKKIIFVSVGRHGSGEKALLDAERQFHDRIQFLRLGPQPENRVSEFLATVDFGIATAPWNLFGKSSSAAAMLDHGLPVIVNRNDVQFRFPVAPTANPRVILMNGDFEQRILTARRSPPVSSREKIAARFCTELEHAA